MWSALHLMDTCWNPLRHQTLASVWLFVVVSMSVTNSAAVTEEFSLTHPSTWGFRAGMICAWSFFQHW